MAALSPAWWLFHLTAGTFGRLGVPFYFVVSHKYFGEKHVKACRDVKEYLRTLKAIEKIDKENEKAMKPVRTDITAETP